MAVTKKELNQLKTDLNKVLKTILDLTEDEKIRSIEIKDPAGGWIETFSTISFPFINSSESYLKKLGKVIDRFPVGRKKK